jgi:GDP-L-fucose synthase
LNRASRIYIAGGDTLIGAALLGRLRSAGYCNLIEERPREPDLTVAGQVEDFFGETRPEYVAFAAGRSGGIRANQARPAELMLDNLLAAAHVLHQAHCHGVRKLLYLASACMYPRQAPQPLRVESLMTGPLESTSEAYAMAKLAGLRLCQAYRHQYGARFISAVPANVFGPEDHFDPEDGHVFGALFHRLHDARLRGDAEVTVWGTGTPRREFVYSADLADACLFVLQNYDGPEPINLGGGWDLSVAEVAHAVAAVVGYGGRICFDPRRPDGAPFKGLDSGPLRALGWAPRAEFRAALRETYQGFLRRVCKEEFTDDRAAVSGAVPHPPG